MWQFGITYVHLGVKVCPMQQTMQTLKLGKVYESRFLERHKFSIWDSQHEPYTILKFLIGAENDNL